MRDRDHTEASSFVAVIAVLACTFCGTTTAHAQGVEITPFGGYRFGGDFFELITNQPVDLDGSVSFGAIVDIPLPRSHSFQIEGLFSHQEADLTIQPTQHGPVTMPARRSTTGSAAACRSSAAIASPVPHRHARPHPLCRRWRQRIRFTLSAGGGVKLFPTRHVGVRLDGRVYTTFVEADVGMFACSSFSGTRLRLPRRRRLAGGRHRGNRLQVLMRLVAAFVILVAASVVSAQGPTAQQPTFRTASTSFAST